MLSITDKFTIPGISGVDFYRDHVREDTVYAVRSTVEVRRDEDGKPALTFNFIERNAEIAYASSENKDLVESQLGQLLLTVDLALTPNEERKALEYLTKILNDKDHLVVKRHLLRHKLRASQKKIVPKISAPHWKNGTVTLEVLKGLGDTFTKSSSDQVQSSNIAWNAASLYATYGIEGSQLMFDALSKGFYNKAGKPEKTHLQAIVKYNAKIVGYIANIEINVNANSAQIYDFIKEEEDTYVREIEQGTKVSSRTSLFWGLITKNRYQTYDKKVDIDREQLFSMVEKMHERKVVNIDVFDNAGMGDNSPEAKAAHDALMANMLNLVTDTVIKNFFETSMITSVTEEKEKVKENEDEDEGEPKSTKKYDTSSTDHIKNQDHYYHFRNKVDKEKITNINFHFKKNSTIEFDVAPNASLMAQLTDSERKAAIRRIDVSSPEIQILQVPVTVNADFEADSINSIVVTLAYKQKDAKSGIVRENKRSFQFRNGDELFTFRATMARNEKNELIDYYDASAKITYKGTADAPPAIAIQNETSKVLVISYEKLGFITTKITAGEIDWEQVKGVVVDMEYPSEPNKPDTKKQIRLSQESLEGSWKCFMYGHKDKQYRYKIKYNFLDGTSKETDYKTDSREELIIDDILIGRIKASFDVLIDSNTVTTAKVEVMYKDVANEVSEEFSKWFTTSETWNWSMRLRENGLRTFMYRYFVQYTDGLVVTSPWNDAESDEDIPPIDLKRYKKSLTIDGGDLDWTKWRIVYAKVRYEDKENKYEREEMVRISQDDFLQTFEILSFSPGSAVYECDLKFSGSGKVIDVSMGPIMDSVVILVDPENPLPADDPETPLQDPVMPVQH